MNSLDTAASAASLGGNTPRWWSLIFYCGVSTLAAALGLAVLFAGATAVFASGQTSADVTQSSQQIFHGVVTDEHCGARHTDKTKSPSDCTRLCVRGGARYALVDGDAVYKLEGNDADLARLAGQRADFAGTLIKDTIQNTRLLPPQQ